MRIVKGNVVEVARASGGDGLHSHVALVLYGPCGSPSFTSWLTRRGKGGKVDAVEAR